MILNVPEALQMAMEVKANWREKTAALACIDALKELCDASHRDAVRQVCQWRALARRHWEWREAKRVMGHEPLVTGPFVTKLRVQLGITGGHELIVHFHMRRETMRVTAPDVEASIGPYTTWEVSVSPRYFLAERLKIVAEWKARMNAELTREHAPLNTAPIYGGALELP